MMPDFLENRLLRPELMDSIDLDPVQLKKALNGLERINRISLSALILWRAIRFWAMAHGQSSLSIIDVACGNGSVLFSLERFAKQENFSFRGLGLDINAHSISFGRARADRLGSSIVFKEWDAHSDTLPGPANIVLSTLFLHHLETSEAERLVEKMAAATAGLLLLQDLVRSYTGYILAKTGTLLLSRSRIVRLDGPQSVRAAFTLAEVAGIIQSLGLHNAVLMPSFPCRFLFTWSKV